MPFILAVVGHLAEPLSYNSGSYHIGFFGYLSNKNESYLIK